MSLEVKKKLVGSISKTIQHFDKCIMMHEDVACVVSSSLTVSSKYRSPGENGKTRDEKNDWRDGLRNAVYTLLVSLFSPTFSRVLVNLTISVVRRPDEQPGMLCTEEEIDAGGKFIKE